MFTRADKLRATKLSRLDFISCTYKIIASFAECWLRFFIKRAGKTPVFERPINVSNEKRSELRFCSKSVRVQSWQSKNTPVFSSMSGDTNFG